MAKAKKKKKNEQMEADTPLQADVVETPEVATEEDVQNPQETLDYWKDKALRAQADMQNMRRRLMADTEDRVRMRLEALLNDLILVADYMEAALGSIPEGVQKAEQADAFLAGMSAIQLALEGVMLGHGMTFIAPKREDEFNPEEHEAVETVTDDSLSKPSLELLSRGYRMGKRILRPAKVKILGPGTPESPAEEA
ncbi:MAG: nucleotide exchange factor GrpE [Planctomycetota bacterium]|nr:MAG: nucleotide exchange factor GrpE [Planctomycetota bacterium]